jgi:hypothetical protein
MSRQILADTSDESATQHLKFRRGSEPAATPIGDTENRPLSEALAGAFPEWDLVPATPFVRRVK